MLDFPIMRILASVGRVLTRQRRYDDTSCRVKTRPTAGAQFFCMQKAAYDEKSSIALNNSLSYIEGRRVKITTDLYFFG